MSIRYLNIFWKVLFRSRSTISRNGRPAGFTLVELLVSIILGSAIIAGLMSLVIELLTTDARETARTETQREMQMALDYISRDIREAVYVYDGACLSGQNVPGKTQGVQNQCSAIFSSIQGPDNSVPILAFWKLDDLPQGVNCPGNPNAADPPPCLAGRSYTFVAYFLARNDGNPTWKGKARIERWELPRYNSNGTAIPQYIDPLKVQGRFTKWPDAGRTPSLQNGAVLVDFLDDRALDNTDLQESLGENNISVDCPPEYVLTPDDRTLQQYGFSNVRNFYACIKVPTALQPVANPGSPPITGAFNQKVILFVRGNAAGKPGIKNANEGYMPAIATQVLNRGVFDKVPE